MGSFVALCRMHTALEQGKKQARRWCLCVVQEHYICTRCTCNPWIAYYVIQERFTPRRRQMPSPRPGGPVSRRGTPACFPPAADPSRRSLPAIAHTVVIVIIIMICCLPQHPPPPSPPPPTPPPRPNRKSTRSRAERLDLFVIGRGRIGNSNDRDE